MASDEEEYLYLYEYQIEGKPYTYFDFFRDRREAERTILFINAGAPYIQTVKLQEAPQGIIWQGVHIPYKKSAWKKMLLILD